MTSVGALAQGMAGGINAGLSMKRRREETDLLRDMAHENAMLRRDALMRSPRGAEGAPAQTGEGAGQPRSMRRGGNFEPVISSDPVNTDLAPHQRAFLNVISSGESAGKYNVRYTPNGGETFDLSTGEHPRIFEPTLDGKDKSSAAGRYQFTATTWDRMGGGDFSPPNQDARAWELAVDDYRRNTGRDLDADLQARGATVDMLRALSGTWEAFQTNPEQYIPYYQKSLDRYTSASSGAPALPKDPPAPRSMQAFANLNT